MCLLHARSDRVLRGHIATQLESSKITMMEWLVLGVIKDSTAKGKSMSEIAGVLHVTLPQVTALINKLLPLKLVRQKSASTDRRSRIVTLTSKGELVFEESTKLLDASQKELFGGLTSTDLEAYVATLKALSTKTS